LTRGCSRARRLLAVALLVCLPSFAPGQEPEREEHPRPPEAENVPSDVPSEERGGKRIVTLFPGGDIYPAYVADLHRTGNGVSISFYSRSEIADSSGTRTGLKAGGRFGVVRWGAESPEGRRWQISIDAGLDAMFDSQHKMDSIGWDGDYGLTATTDSFGRFSYKIGLLHTSSHVGDEYMERTGRTRIDYTREELALGARFRAAPEWNAYAELGIAYKELTEEQARWRWQGGVEWESSRTLLRGHFVWYAAFDLALWQERDWRPDVALQGGLAARGGGRTWRFGVEYSNGRVPLGEFFMDTEARVTLGIWVDP
jgi:Protein of unknown function (DUF1207)